MINLKSWLSQCFIDRLRLMWICLPMLFLLGFAGGSFAADGEMVLVKDGLGKVPIVVFADAPPKTRRAADELAEYIEKISGARLPVIEGRPSPLPQKAVWIGYQPAMDEIFPDLDFDFEHPEEILIATNENNLVIAGRDRWNPDQLRVEYPGPGRSTYEVNGVQQEYGTINAVYTFLQDYLDVRWLWPGELGEDIIAKDTIAFAPFEYRYHPQLRSRAGILRFSNLTAWRGHSHKWCRFQRLQLDSLTLVAGHNFSDWWGRFHETNPDFFALQPNGTRTWPSPRTVKICKSNPGVWEQWMTDVENELENDPNKNVFFARPNDGAYSGYCVCENCLAWDHPDAEKVRYRWEGISQKYVAQSDRLITFVNTLARMLKERFPDRDDLFVATSTYGNAHPVPIGVTPEDNVIVVVFANIHNRPFPDKGRGSRQNLVDWSRSGTKHIRWGANMGGGAGWQLGFPNMAPRRVIDDMRFVADNNVMAVVFDTMWEHWANQGPHYYMLAQMAWKPYADGEAILTDYYQRAFGPAADAMTAYWELMEQTSDEIVFDGRPMEEVWNVDFYPTGYALLEKATEQLADAPGKYRRRVDFVRAGLDFMRLYNENQQLIHRIKETFGKDAAALEAARANWEKIEQIFKEHPLALSRWVRGPRARLVNPDHQIQEMN